RGVDLPLREGGWQLLSASPVPYTPMSARPNAMDEDDMERIRRSFAAATERCVAAGADAVELNFAQGYLVGSFLSPLTNRRTDDFGGSLDVRLRFPLSVLGAVRAAAGNHVVIVRLSVTDWARGGVTPDEGVEIARRFGDAGADMIHVVAGQTVAGGQPEYRRAYLTSLAGRVRIEAGIPVLVGGYLTTPDEVSTIVGAGRADLCLVEAIDSELDSGISDERLAHRVLAAR
ncbi:MAG: hypothetical protein M3161_06200, partial [Actinomycetota bacterium]|nr:hypothetical protein [Actinomycetota bacterium]